MFAIIGFIASVFLWALLGWSIASAVLLTIGIVGYLDTHHFGFVLIGLVGFWMALKAG